MYTVSGGSREYRVKPSDRRGVALVVVLALLVALGLTAGVVARAVRLESNTVETLRARTVARYAAESGVVATEWRIQTLLDSLPLPAERAGAFRDPNVWLGPLAKAELGAARFQVVVVDLNARVDLNRSDSATVQGLFAQFTGESRAAGITAAIRTKPLYRVGELALVPGVDVKLAAAVAPYITVWSDGTVNLNSAPEPVLAAQPALGDAGARGIVERRRSGELFTSTTSIVRQDLPMTSPSMDDTEDASFGDVDQAFTAAPAGQSLPASTAPTHFLVVSRGWRAGHPLTHEVQAVYAAMGTRLVLQMWQERDL